MRSIKLILGAFLSSLPLLFSDAAHTFTATDGRTLEANIVRYQPDHDLVEIKRTDGTLLRVKSTLFESADQTYIQKWYAAQQFASSHFRMQIKEVEGSYKKQTHSIDFGEEAKRASWSWFWQSEIATDKKPR